MAGSPSVGKDHFSGHAADYARFRPGYPEALFDWVAEQTTDHDLAWDCGCGNGQASVPLASRYTRVAATDFSAKQIAHAPLQPNIEYRVAPAEASGLADGCANVVTIAQALHWFDFERFYAEVRRVVKPGGLIAAWTYQLLRGEPGINTLLDDFYRNTLAPHWPPERQWVDLAYRDMPFPFKELPPPAFEIELTWSLDDLLAYLGTWSATRRCVAATGHDPLPALRERLAPVWGGGVRNIVWPIAMKAGYV